MKPLFLTAVLVLAVSSLRAQLAISSPATGTVVTHAAAPYTTPIALTQIPAATDHVNFCFDGRCLQNNIARTPPFTLQYAPGLYGDSYGVQVYAVAKDIF